MRSARRMVGLEFTSMGRRILHRHRGAFYRWNGTRYEEVDHESMRSDVWWFLDAAKRVGKGDSIEYFRPNRAKVADVVEALQAVTKIPSSVSAPTWLSDGGDLPPAATMFPVDNGAVHLASGLLYEPSPELFNLHGADWLYDPNPPEPEQWVKFLKSLWSDDDGSIATLQEWIGYCLGTDTGLQKILLMIGPTRSGKGTIARVVTALIGRNSVAAPTLNALASNFGLAPLIGRPLAIIPDARVGHRSDLAAITERLLAISGEDSVSIDRKFQSAWIGRLSTRFMLLTNELPRLADASGALAGRFIILKLQQSFYGREDHDLENRLLAELPGIFLWALEGRQRLLERGYFEENAGAKDLMVELETLAAPVSAFVKEFCVVGPQFEVKVDVLFEEWKKWCDLNGYRNAGNKQSFGQKLRATIPSLKTTQRKLEGVPYRVFQGVDFN
jgi:putative DNA primase/helicase